eukprot:1008282-Amphidinium_carterae.1
MGNSWGRGVAVGLWTWLVGLKRVCSKSGPDALAGAAGTSAHVTESKASTEKKQKWKRYCCWSPSAFAASQTHHWKASAPKGRISMLYGFLGRNVETQQGIMDRNNPNVL